MRRSSIWFFIAALWLIDVILSLIRGHGMQSLLPAGIALIFVIVGLLHRRHESATLKSLR